MKRILSKSLICLLVCSLFFSGCKKDSDDNNSNNTLATSPDAKSEHDTKSGGVYKGVIIGSSGTLKIMLQDGKLEAVLTIDGVTRTLTTTGLGSWTSGQAVTNVAFSNGNWQLSFSVNANGANPVVVLNISGHPNAVAAIIKELSTQLLRVYEGTYTGTGVSAPANTWNFMCNDSQVYGIHSNSPSPATVNGSKSGNNVSGTTSSGASFSGTFNGNNVSGQWTSGSNSGSWSGARKI